MSSEVSPIAQPQAFCVVDAHGQVVMRGQSLDLPQIPGHTTLAEIAPEGAYRDGDGWTAMSAQPGPHHTFDWSVRAWVDRTLEQLRGSKLAEINARFSEESTELTAGYPAAERQTWAAQEAEALAWSLDPLTPTPYLDGIAAARGIEFDDMRAKTLDAVTAFRVASQWLVGTRQALRDAIQDSNATREQLEAIAWPTDPQE